MFIAWCIWAGRMRADRARRLRAGVLSVALTVAVLAAVPVPGPSGAAPALPVTIDPVATSVRAKLTAQLPGSPPTADHSLYAEFGTSVAVDGDTAVVGSPYEGGPYGTDGGVGSGSAYVYVRSGDGWTIQAKLTAQQPGTPVTTDVSPGDFFGESVAIDGDTIVIGSASDDDGGENSGSAYVYVRSGTAWTVQAKLNAQLSGPPLTTDAAPGDLFGKSVSVEGDTIVIGSPSDDDGGENSGSAYVYVRSGQDWTIQQKLTAQRPGPPVADDATPGDRFAGSVSVDRDTVVVSSHLDNDDAINSGSAYVYVRRDEDWTIQQKLTAQLPGSPPTADAALHAFFGWSVDIDGDTVVIGSPLDDAGGEDSGAAYVYVRSGEDWTIEQKLSAQRRGLPVTADAAEMDWFGRAVSVDGDTVVIGSPLDDDGGEDTGSAYVFVRADSMWTVQTKVVAQLPGSPPTADAARQDHFGWSVDIAGDTVVVGSPLDETRGDGDWGSVYVYDVDQLPVAIADDAAVAENDPATPINVLANDTDVDSGTMTIEAVAQPADGAAVITGGGSGLTYQPDPDFCTATGTVDAFTYTLNGGSSATVRMTVDCAPLFRTPGGDVLDSALADASFIDLLADVLIPMELVPVDADTPLQVAPDRLSVVLSKLTDLLGTSDTAGRYTQDRPVGVLVASSEVFADALASGPLQTGGTRLLLTDPDRLDPALLTEIARLDVDTVTILGGTDAVRPEVEDALGDAGYGVDRIDGPTRIETAAAIAAQARGTDRALLARAYPAEGSTDPTQAFADSLAAGGWAASSGTGLLLTQTDTLTDTTAAAIHDGTYTDVTVIGGQTAISDDVLTSATLTTLRSVRVAGPDRFATAVQIAQSRTANPEQVIIVEGQAATAWTAGFISANPSDQLDAPIILTSGDIVPQVTIDYLTTIQPTPGQPSICIATPTACTTAESQLNTSSRTVS